MGLPGWFLRALIVVAVLGFPVALALAWFYEIGDAGITRDTAPPEAARPRMHGLRRYADVVIIGALLVTVATLLARQADVGQPKPPESPAIAVLPFENLGDDPEQAYFADGLAEELLDQLGQVPGLRVVARNSSFRFRGANADARDVAARLGATTILQGSVRRSGNRLKLSARLVDGRTGYQVWSGSFDREMTEVFAVQQELAVAVVDALVPAARGGAVDLEPTRSADLGAYDLYLVGKQAVWQRSPESIRRAVTALERSIELDPDFAPAHAELSLALGGASAYTDADPEAARKRAAAAAYRALALDPDLPAGHLALAFVHSYRGDDREAILGEIKRAVDLNPNYALAVYQYGRHLGFAGRDAEAAEWLDKALQLDPLATTPRANRILELNLRGEDALRDAELERFAQLHHDDADALAQLARTYLRIDDPLRAAAAARRAIALAPEGTTPGAVIYLQRALIAVGALDDAERLADGTDWRATNPLLWAAQAALVAGARPDLRGMDQALTELEALPGDPTRAAGLVYWAAVARRHPEISEEVVEEAWGSEPLRTYTLLGLRDGDIEVAQFWVFTLLGPVDQVQAEKDKVLADLRARVQKAPLDVPSLLDLAAIESIAGQDAAAIATLERAFQRSPVPIGFQPHLPWFARLAGQPGFDEIVKRWDASRTALRQRVLARS